MTEQTKAQRLAEFMSNVPDVEGLVDYNAYTIRQASAELRRLDALNAELVEALELARTSHGLLLMGDPPQEAWKYHRVDEKIRAALAKAKEQT